MYIPGRHEFTVKVAISIGQRRQFPSAEQPKTIGTAHHFGSRKLSFPYRPIYPAGGNRPQVLTEGADRCFRMTSSAPGNSGITHQRKSAQSLAASGATGKALIASSDEVS